MVLLKTWSLLQERIWIISLRIVGLGNTLYFYCSVSLRISSNFLSYLRSSHVIMHCCIGFLH